MTPTSVVEMSGTLSAAPKRESIDVTYRIAFEFGSDRIDAEAKQILDEIVATKRREIAAAQATLPLAELAPTRPALVYLQGEINVNQAGPIAIDIHCTEPAHVWLDAEPFERTKRFISSVSCLMSI